MGGGGGGGHHIYEQQLGELHKKEGSNLEALNNFRFLGFINSKEEEMHAHG
jgi:hypothetical protein